MRAICRTVLRGLCVVAVLPSVLLAVGLCAFWRWLWDDDDAAAICDGLRRR